MNTKTWIPLVVAVALGLAAAWMARNNLKTATPAATPSKMAPLVVAAIAIEPGHVLAAGDLKVARMAIDEAPDGAFADIKQLVGRVSTVAVPRGQPLMEALLAPAGSGGGLQAMVPANMRALTLEVNEFSGLAGLVSPGCRVDLISTLHDAKSTELLTKTIVQNVKVTAVGQRMTATNSAGQQEPIRSVTLLVEPEQAEIIQLASASGRPWLSLRGHEDWDVPNFTSPGITLARLRSPVMGDDDVLPVAKPPTTQPLPTPAVTVVPVNAVETPKAPDRKAPIRWPVRLYLGGQETMQYFELKNPPKAKGTDSSTSIEPFPLPGVEGNE